MNKVQQDHPPSNPQENLVANSPKWLPLQEAAVRYGYHSPRAFREWAKRHNIQPGKLGNKLFYRGDEIDQALERSRNKTTVPKTTRQDTAERALSRIGGV